MQTIFAIDTAYEQCSVALSVGGQVKALQEHDVSQHSRRLLVMVDQLLAEASISWPDIGLLVWSAGPGSFTGLRMAASFCQAQAAVHGTPVLGVSTLEALAQAACLTQALPDQACVVVTVDARMGEVYAGTYQKTGDAVVTLQPDSLIPATSAALSEYMASLDGEPICLVGNGWQLPSLQSLSETYQQARVDNGVAAALVAIGQRRMPVNVALSLKQPDATIEPVYLRGVDGWKKTTAPRLLPD